MSTVENLKEKALSTNIAYLKLLQKYKFDSNEMHYVFEGFEDQSFYFNFLEKLSDKYVTYVSYGKRQSIELYSKIDWSKYDKKRIVIFIDRDYCRWLGEDIPEDENIYETTYYSIENYISDSTILRRLINEILHFHDADVIDQIANKYEREVDVFLKAIKPVIAWILIVRSHKLKANLNMIDLSKLFKVDLELNFAVLPGDKMGYLEKSTHIKTPKVFFSVFKDWYLTINNQASYKAYLRGKYELWFLITFFHRVNSYLLNKHAHNSKVKTNINESNAIEIIGPRTAMPKRLNDFLKKIKPDL